MTESAPSYHRWGTGKSSSDMSVRDRDYGARSNVPPRVRIEKPTVVPLRIPTEMDRLLALTEAELDEMEARAK